TGQLGDGSFTTRLTPVLVAGTDISKSTKAIAAGTEHTCFLLAEARGLNSLAVCWGGGGHGQLGNGGITNHFTADSTAVGLLNAVAIAAGDFHSCALNA